MISVAGITIGAAALIIVLSVFNGFEGLVVSLFNTFNPDLRITAIEGRTFPENNESIMRIRALSGVKEVTLVLEENALVTYGDKQTIATLKGVSRGFHITSSIDTMMTEGNTLPENESVNTAIVGQGIAYYLGLRLNDYSNPLTLYVPRRDAGPGSDPMNAFSSTTIHPCGIFSIQQDFDQKFIIVPLGLIQSLAERDSVLSALEIAFVQEKGYNLNGTGTQNKTREEIKRIIGPGFEVKNRFEQEEFLYGIMKSEKLAVFIILSFILLIAIFNVIGSLSMLILDKKKDIAVFKCLGASDSLIRRIFFAEGMLITLSGAAAGMLSGALVCYLQQTFGIITLTGGGGFVVDAYPVKMYATDFLMVFVVVCTIGFVASWYPVKYISKKYLGDRLG